MSKSPSTRPLALLVGIQLPQVSDEEHQASLDELGRLMDTLGYQTLAKKTQRRSRPRTGTVLGAGKLMELAKLTGGSGIVQRFGADDDTDEEEGLQGDEQEESHLAQELSTELDEPDDAEGQWSSADLAQDDGRRAEVVAFDLDLSPTELRNVESALGVPVLDRTGIIVEIFHRHARTREARAQVEIARLKYLAPRMRFLRKKTERQGGGIGAKGVGETAHELDRRRIRDRIAELNRELQDLKAGQEQRRQRRKDQARVALVGYTNAGKSSLMRRLTGSEVLVQDKLFATLDTTVRTLVPPSVPKVLVSDTVGFIKKLPHDLVASFRSTLDEAQGASLLLFVVDASDPTMRSQLQVTQEVLGDIVGSDTTRLLILNKIDRVPLDQQPALRREFPDAVLMSTLSEADVAALRARIIALASSDMIEAELKIPYAQSALIGDIRSCMQVLAEDYRDEAMVFKVKAFSKDLQRVQTALTPR